MKFPSLFLIFLSTFSLLAADSPRCGADCGDGVNPGSITDEENPDTIERVEQDFENQDDPSEHVPGQVGPFGE